MLGDGTQVRHYTYGGDLARGIVTAMEHPAALNEDFNLSTADVDDRARAGRDDLAQDQGPDAPLPRRARRPVRPRRAAARAATVDKARDVLGFEATTTLDEMLDEVIPWIAQALEEGRI